MNENVNILYEDKEIIVVYKPAKVPTQTKRVGAMDMVSILKNYLYKNAKEKKEPYLAVVHRLDQPVEGILVFAKTAKAAKFLNGNMQKEDFGKYYKAIVSGIVTKDEETRIDYLVKDGRTNTSRVCQKDEKDAKLAKLSYEVLERNEEKNCTLLKICLSTGRHHQIRVQMAQMGHPIVGDTKYNPDAGKGEVWEQIALCAYHLEFQHPVTKKKMTFEVEPKFYL